MPTLTPEQLAKLKGGNGPTSQAQRPGPAASNASGISTGGSATATSGASVTTELIPGLQPQVPTNMKLQKGDQAVAAGTPARADGLSPDGEKIGRNDPCWCGSGKKFKRCHGAA
jgi:preprotein translocase subunit SecA